jgi:streptogramin lyase
LVVAGIVFSAGGGSEPDGDREFFRVQRFEAGRTPQDVAVEGTSAWVTLAEDRAVARFDTLTGEPVGDPQPVGEIPAGITTGFGSVWVGFAEGATVVRLDQTSGTVLNAGIVSGRSPHALAIGREDVWVAAISEGRVSRIDPDNVVNAAADIFRAGGMFPSDVAFGFGRLWVTDIEEGHVAVLDPASPRRRQRTIDVGESPIHVAIGDAAVWVANQNFGDGTLTRIDPETLDVIETIPIGGEIGGLAVGDGYVWVTLSETGRLVRVNPATNEIDGVPIAVGGAPLGLDVADGFVWIADQAEGEVIRVELNASVG